MASKFQQFMKCSLCTRDFTDLRILPCLHSACKNCLLEDIKTHGRKERYLTCLECGKISLIPVGDVAALPKNDMIEPLKEWFKQPKPSATNNSGRRQNSACEKHPSQPLSDFCDTCRVPVCPACFKTTHDGHEKRDLAAVAKESKSDLDCLTELAKAIDKRLAEQSGQLDKSGEKIGEDDKDICEKIDKAGEELKKLITERVEVLKKKVEGSKKVVVKALEGATDEIKCRRTAVQKLRSYIHVVKTTGSDIDQVVHLPGLEHQLQQLDALPKSAPVSWNVTLPRRERHTMAVLLGTVETCEALTSSGIVTGSRQNALDAHRLALFEPDVGREIGWRSRVSGLVAIGNFVYVTGYEKPYLWAQNMKTNAGIQHTLKGMSAVGMAVLHSNTYTNSTLVITDHNKKLHFVKVSTQGSIENHKVQALSFEPRQVSVDSKTGLMVIARKALLKTASFVVCDNLGDEMKKVPKNLWGFSRVLPADDGYVVRSDNIYWTNKEGDVTDTYLNGERSKELDSERYNDMTFDSRGRLIATDYKNHRVHLIDADTKQLLEHVLTEKPDFKYPSRVFLDEREQRLFVGHYDNKNHTAVSVYDWPFIPGEHQALRVQLNSYHDN